MEFTTDDNNNAAGEKSYSLRPRTLAKRERDDLEEEESWKPRGRSRRKQKQKSAPLSKYRRKTANARERSRMREINDAFEALRKAIPHLASTCDNNNEKISKIMTLRLAMKYITALSNALEEPESYAFNFQTTLSLMDTSSTTSSASDHPTWRDQLFTSTPPLESTSSVESPLSCSAKSYDSTITNGHLDNSLKDPASQSVPQTSQDTYSNFFTRTSDSSSTISLYNTSSLSSHQLLASKQTELCRHTLTPPEEPVLHLPEEFQLNSCSGTSEFQSSTSLFSTDFDGLPSPVMDFCDLFIT